MAKLVHDEKDRAFLFFYMDRENVSEEHTLCYLGFLNKNFGGTFAKERGMKQYVFI